MPDRWLDYLPLDELIPADDNPNLHHGSLIDESIEAHGLVAPSAWRVSSSTRRSCSTSIRPRRGASPGPALSLDPSRLRGPLRFTTPSGSGSLPTSARRASGPLPRRSRSLRRSLRRSRPQLITTGRRGGLSARSPGLEPFCGMLADDLTGAR